MDILNNLGRAVLAGICISIGGIVYLKVGGVAGAVLFAFGLLAVVTLQLNLFTGKSQFGWGADLRGYSWLLVMLAGNFAGCLLTALAVYTPALSESASSIIETRLAAGPLRCGVLAVGCGFIMTTAVRGAAAGNWWALLFGVPAFIICGFPHCVADAFYISASLLNPAFAQTHDVALILPFYGAAVLGNFLGCNLYRLALPGAPSPFPAEAKNSTAQGADAEKSA